MKVINSILAIMIFASFAVAEMGLPSALKGKVFKGGIEIKKRTLYATETLDVEVAIERVNFLKSMDKRMSYWSVEHKRRKDKEKKKYYGQLTVENMDSFYVITFYNLVSTDIKKTLKKVNPKNKWFRVFLKRTSLQKGGILDFGSNEPGAGELQQIGMGSMFLKNVQVKSAYLIK